jgi:SAM-dependent methyltransferase
MNDHAPAMSVEQYDRGWETKWDDMKRHGPMSRHIRRLIMNTVRPLRFTDVLDVGCGQGSLLADMVDEFAHIKPYGTDVSQSGLELARQKVPSGTFSILDLAAGRLDRMFDLVICSEVLEHIPDDIAAIRNLAAMTGRYLVVTTVQGRMRRFEAGEVGHVRNYAYGELIQKIQASGLNVSRTIEWGFPFYSPLYRDLLDLMGGQGTTGEFGPIRKSLSTMLYWLFMLNSWTRGDEIVVVAEKTA